MKKELVQLMTVQKRRENRRGRNLMKRNILPNGMKRIPRSSYLLKSLMTLTMIMTCPKEENED